MKIKESDVAVKKIAGETKSGDPIIYIMSHGGLHAVFTRGNDGSIESIAAAPHPAIMKFLAEKKSPGIQWESDFYKSESGNLAKSENERYRKLKNIVFSAPQDEALQSSNESFIIYDYRDKSIQILSKTEVDQAVISGELNSHSVIRDLSLTGKPMILIDYLESQHE